MRCDYPMGYDEDYLEPACEIFLQLFLQNAQIAGNEDQSQDNDGILNAEFGGYESDDNASFPSLHTISDDSLSSGELSGDEEEGLVVVNEESNFAPSSINDLFGNLENEDSSSPAIDSEEVYELIDEYTTDMPSENHETSRPSLIVNNQNSDDASNLAFQESNSRAALTSDSLSDEDETDTFMPSESFFSAADHIDNTLPYDDDIPSDDDDFPSSPDTYVSLYVVVPPTSFSHESDNLLSEVPSDRVLSDVTPVGSASPSIVSDNGNSPREDESSCTVHMCDNSGASNSSAICSSCSVSEKSKHYTTEMDSTLHGDNSISSESTIGCDENSHLEFAMFDTHLSEGKSVHQDENSDCEITSDKSGANLKRKVVSPTDDDVINKVPKYSVSQESNDSISEVSLDQFCAELSSGNEVPELSDVKIDVPPVIDVEDDSLPSKKSTEENSAAEHQTDL